LLTHSHAVVQAFACLVARLHACPDLVQTCYLNSHITTLQSGTANLKIKPAQTLSDLILRPEMPHCTAEMVDFRCDPCLNGHISCSHLFLHVTHTHTHTLTDTHTHRQTHTALLESAAVCCAHSSEPGHLRRTIQTNAPSSVLCHSVGLQKSGQPGIILGFSLD